MSIKIMSGEELNKAIIGVNKSANKLAGDVQAILVSTMYYALKEGSVSELNALWLGTGKGAVRRDAMKNWAIAFGPFVVNDNKKTMAEKPFVFSRERADTILGMENGASKDATVEQVMLPIETAARTMWTEYKEPPMVVEDWDVLTAVRKLLADAKKMGTKKVHIINAPMLDELQKLIPAETQGV
jgi:hypothetical protein